MLAVRVQAGLERTKLPVGEVMLLMLLPLIASSVICCNVVPLNVMKREVVLPPMAQGMMPLTSGTDVAV